MGQSQVSTGMIILAIVALLAIVASMVAGWVIIEDLGDSGDNDTNTEVLAAGLAVGRHANALNSVSSVASNFTMTGESPRNQDLHRESQGRTNPAVGQSGWKGLQRQRSAHSAAG